MALFSLRSRSRIKLLLSVSGTSELSRIHMHNDSQRAMLGQCCSRVFCGDFEKRMSTGFLCYQIKSSTKKSMVKTLARRISNTHKVNKKFIDNRHNSIFIVIPSSLKKISEGSWYVMLCNC